MVSNAVFWISNTCTCAHMYTVAHRQTEFIIKQDDLSINRYLKNMALFIKSLNQELIIAIYFVYNNISGLLIEMWKWRMEINYIIDYTSQFQHFMKQWLWNFWSRMQTISRIPNLNLSHIQILRVYDVRKASLCNDKSKTSLKCIQINLREKREL